MKNHPHCEMSSGLVGRCDIIILGGMGVSMVSITHVVLWSRGSRLQLGNKFLDCFVFPFLERDFYGLGSQALEPPHSIILFGFLNKPC